MPERRRCCRFWPYGALSVIAFARRGAEPRPRAHETRSTTRRRSRSRTDNGHAQASMAVGAQRRGALGDFRARVEGHLPAGPMPRSTTTVSFRWRRASSSTACLPSSLRLPLWFRSMDCSPNSSTIDGQVSMLSGILPGGALDILHEELRRLAANKGANSSAGFARRAPGCALERECRDEGDHRRAQRRLWREGEAKPRQAEPRLAA